MSKQLLRQMAEDAQRIEDEATMEGKAARTGMRLYNFDARKVGGYTRLPNVYLENLASFKAKNYVDRTFLQDKKGKNLYCHTKKDADGNIIKDEKGKIVECPDPLEPLDHLILQHCLMWYQRIGNKNRVAFSKAQIAREIGKSERQIHRSVKKLKELKYITETGKKAVKGGHIVEYNITVFLEMLEFIAKQNQKSKARKKKNSFSDFSQDTDETGIILEEMEVAPK